VKKPVPVESLALDTSGPHVSRRSQILVERLANVVAVGNSVAGWIAAETALRKSPRALRVIFLDAVVVAIGEIGRRTHQSHFLSCHGRGHMPQPNLAE
jgi:hypothetical protein